MTRLVSVLLLLCCAAMAHADGIVNGGSSSFVIGTTPITGGADTQILFNNAGVVSSDAGATKVAGATGAVTFGGTLNLPDAAAGPIGIINFGGARMLHNFGTTNLFVGKNAGNFTLTGTQNTCLGSSACNALAGGSTNTVMGESAGLALAGANNNTLIGRFSGGSNAAAANVTAVGSGALSTTTGASNTGVGFSAGANIAGGTSNTIIGSATGLGITTGVSNTIIGQGVNSLPSGLSNSIILAIGGGVIEADFASTTAATWTFNGALAASLNAATGTNAVCNTPGTKTAITVQVWATGCAASSIRFKEGIASIDPAKALDDVLRFQPVSYFYKPEFNMGRDKHIGFTAEQVATVDPFLVTFEDDGVTPHAVKYNEMTPLLVAAIQQLKADNDNLKAEIEALRVAR